MQRLMLAQFFIALGRAARGSGEYGVGVTHFEGCEENHCNCVERNA